jgi:chloramphenicol-sensitive protein RarD
MRDQARLGVVYALLAFGAWGFNPIYFKAVGGVPALEVLAHRVLWSVPLLALLVTLAGTWPRLRAALAEPRTLLSLVASTLILSGNWFVYIYAINTERIVETSLGYYMNPLLIVLLGVIFLRERLSRLQALAVLLAAAGVLNLIVQLGTVPWIALFLAGSFGVYGLIRKVVTLGSIEGLLAETTLMLPLALSWIAFIGLRGEGSFLTGGWGLDVLIILAGPVTALPLIWFASGARRLNYATVGIFQYIAPSIQFVLGVFAYDEPFGLAHLITFACIWTALVIYTTDTLRRAARSDERS